MQSVNQNNFMHILRESTQRFLEASAFNSIVKCIDNSLLFETIEKESAIPFVDLNQDLILYSRIY